MTDVEGTEVAELVLEFCGESVKVPYDRPFSIGRSGDFVIDESHYLHRRFLELRHHDGLWWVSNLGTQIGATLSDPASGLHAWLTPGASMPLVVPVTVVRFSAGPTAYELELRLSEAPYVPTVPAENESGEDGQTTTGRLSFTPDQRLLIVALAEPVLRRGGSGMTELPSNAEAARRLGWQLTRFNRKLDNVCQKLDRAGVRGLHGSVDRLAQNRRARLVEHAVAASIVTAADLALLDADPTAGLQPATE